MEPYVTIVVAVYNGHKYLRRCVNSLLNQTWQNWECLLIDDGSTDGITPDLCDQIAGEDSRIIAVHKKNGGACSAWQYGMDHAKGNWVFVLDQDDCYSSNLIKEVLSAQEADPTGMMMWKYTHNLNDLYQDPLAKEDILSRSISEIGQLYMESQLYTLWNMSYRTDIVRKHNITLPLGVTYGTDLIFSIEYIKACIQEGFTHYSIVQKPFYYYEIGNEDSVTSHYQPTYLDDELMVTEYLLEAFVPPIDIPQESFCCVLRNCMRTMGEGFGYIMQKETDLPLTARKKKIQNYINHPAFHKLLLAFNSNHLYSPYLFPIKHQLFSAIELLFRLKQENSRWYDRLFWLGYYVHTALTGNKDTPYL